MKKNFWEKYFEVYDTLNYLIPYQDLAKKIIDSLNINVGEKILDAGAGTGNIAMLCKDRGANMFSIDNSKEALNIYKKKDSDAKILHGNLLKELPFKNNYFDKIYSNNTLYIISREERPKIIKEFYRILKPGGILVLSNLSVDFNPLKIYSSHIKSDFKKRGALKTLLDVFYFMIPTIKIFYYNFLIQKENKTGGYSFFKKNEQKMILEEAGFKDVKSDVLVYSGCAILNSAIKK